MLFNDTIMYNIGYGGVRDPVVKHLLDKEDDAQAQQMAESREQDVEPTTHAGIESLATEWPRVLCNYAYIACSVFT